MKRIAIIFGFNLLILAQHLTGQKPKLMLPIGHTDKVYTAVFSPDEKRVLTASGDNTAKLWDVASGSLLRELKGHIGEVVSAIYSPDGKQILTASYDSTARLWNAATGTFIRELRHNNSVTSAVFSADGKNILTTVYSIYGTNQISMAVIWDAASGKTIHKINLEKNSSKSAVFSPDGKTILSSGDTTKLWDVTSGRLLRRFRHEEFVKSAVFSEDGKQIATAGAYTLRIWNGSSDAVHRKVIYNYEFVSAKFTADGRTVLTMSADQALVIWDVASGKLVKKLLVNEGKFVSPSSKGNEDKFEHVVSSFNVISGKSNEEIEGHKALFSP